MRCDNAMRISNLLRASLNPALGKESVGSGATSFKLTRFSNISSICRFISYLILIVAKRRNFTHASFFPQLPKYHDFIEKIFPALENFPRKNISIFPYPYVLWRFFFYFARFFSRLSFIFAATQRLFHAIFTPVSQKEISIRRIFA